MNPNSTVTPNSENPTNFNVNSTSNTTSNPQPNVSGSNTKTIITVLLLLLFYPVGLILMWLGTTWRLWVKLLITLPIILAILGFLVAGMLLAINPAEQIDRAKKMSENTTNSVTNNSNNVYPKLLKTNYLEACLKAGGEQKYCDCTLKYLEDRYTVQEYAKAEQDYINDPTKTSIFTDATYACLNTLEK